MHLYKSTLGQFVVMWLFVCTHVCGVSYIWREAGVCACVRESLFSTVEITWVFSFPTVKAPCASEMMFVCKYVFCQSQMCPYGLYCFRLQIIESFRLKIGLEPLESTQDSM